MNKPEKKEFKRISPSLTDEELRIEGYNQCWDDREAWHKHKIEEIKAVIELCVASETMQKMKDALPSETEIGNIINSNVTPMTVRDKDNCYINVPTVAKAISERIRGQK